MTTLVGILIGIGAILLGHWLEGGNLASVSQLTAAVIVLGGTAGAVVTQFPAADLKQAMRQLPLLWANAAPPQGPMIDRIVDLARRSRRDGLLALDNESQKIADPFLRDAVLALVDGYDASALRALLEKTIEQDEIAREPGPRLFEAAGGYAPTLGILGAVLGLIQVMENLADPSKLGAGIAVAFVATVYGVGSANLIFLPIAGKMKLALEEDSQRKELIMEGVCAMREGVNPQVIRKRLRCFANAHSPVDERGRGAGTRRRGR